MGIQERAVQYLSDRGDTFELANMQSSHLLNVIHHHSNQVTTLELLADDERFNTPAVKRRLDGLKATVIALQAELALREPHEDHELQRSHKCHEDERW